MLHALFCIRLCGQLIIFSKTQVYLSTHCAGHWDSSHRLAPSPVPGAHGPGVHGMRMQVLWFPLGQQSAGSPGYHNLKLTVGGRLSPLLTGRVQPPMAPILSWSPTLFRNAETVLKGTPPMHVTFPSPVGEAQGLNWFLPPPTLPPKSKHGLGPQAQHSVPCHPPVFRDDGAKSLPSTPRLWGWTQASAVWILQAQGQGDAMGRTSPQPVYGPAAISSSNLRPPFISAGPAPGSQQQPPHCSLPASDPVLQEYAH